VQGLRVFFFFACGFFLSYLYRSVNAVLAPELVGDFGLGADQLGFLTSVFLLAFAAFQSVLGMLLDRFGPRRVEAALLVVAAGGALLFALAPGFEMLVAGRALIGIGVSACLMAGLKANVLWFDGPRLPLINGLFMAAGGIGAVCAGVPVELALSVTDWRGVLLGVSALTLLLAAAQIAFVPERAPTHGVPDLPELFAGLGRVYKSRAFWQVAPLTMVSQGAWLATQGLWAGPWLADVSDLGRLAVANHLSTLAASMAVGFFLAGLVTERLQRVGISAKQVAGAGMGLFIVVQILIVAFPEGPTLWLWGAYGLFGVAGVITYTTLTQRFGASLAGRANTAQTLAVFATAFVFQAGAGSILELFPAGEPGHYTAAGHRLTMLIAIAVQGLALIWYVAFRERRGFEPEPARV